MICEIFGFTPVFGFATWIIDYIKYNRVKGQYWALKESE
jgi:hypothetical protein